jgi:hypothetical protein
MSDETESAEPDIPAPALKEEGPVNAREAARQLTAWRSRQAQPQETKAAAPELAAAASEPAPESEQVVAPLETEATGATETQDADPAQEPTLARPRSWPKEHDEHWSRLDRETQQYLLDRDQQDSAVIRRGQNEVAEKAKTLAAREQAAEEQRQRYEQAVANTLETLTSRTEFADIKTSEDVRKLADEDPFRYVKYQAHQDSVNKLQTEHSRLQQQRAQEQTQRFANWADEQDKEFASRVKEFADPKKAAEIREKVIMPYLTGAMGITSDVLTKLWQEPIFRASEMQQMIYDAARFHAAKSQAKAIVQTPRPAPQRPGVGQGKGAEVLAHTAQLEKRLENAKGFDAVRAATDLLQARRAQSRR